MRVCKTPAACFLDNTDKQQTVHAVHAFIREWTEEGQLWVQYVSSTPATRLDVINLQEKLDQQLQQRQVSSRVIRGGCPYLGLHAAQRNLCIRSQSICP